MAKRKGSEGGGIETPAAGTGGVAGTTTAAMKPYVVLARKYRPQTFDDLIGQDAMVRTLRNAFATGRIAQAYMLTGVRGVGKTTTARILARGLNYRTAAIDRPTIDMAELGEHCQAIIDSRHPDIIEMDAASNTGIENVREIIENSRYRPVSARMKVFIIDEVHMLSKNAFNGLLKTLEEPPEHVKFIFATTEVRKVPVTVLSRCQRFDLRRVEVPVLAAHLQSIARREGQAIADEAVLLVARAAEGSVRDGLSMLDQALATAAAAVTPDLVRSMLGLADRGRVFDLLEAMLAGSTKQALELLEALNRDGADPLQLLADLAEAIHVVTRIKVAGVPTDTLSGEERRRGSALAGRLGVDQLTRLWQMLVKGLEDAGRSPNSLAAAEMIVIRICHAAGLPSPEDLIKRLDGSAAPARQRAAEPPPSPSAAAEADFGDEPPEPYDPPEDVLPSIAPPPVPSVAGSDGRSFQSFAELVDFVGERRDLRLKVELEDRVRLVRFEPPRLELRLLDGADSGLPNALAQKLSKWTGERWMVAVSRETGERPIGEVRREREAAELAQLKAQPEMQALLKTFPAAEILSIHPLQSAETEEKAESRRDDDSAMG